MIKGNLRDSPHIRHKDSNQGIMRDVIIALMPVLFAATYAFGFRVLLISAVGIITSVGSEYIYQKITNKKVTIHDLSAVVTGLLLALSLASNVPLWTVVLGSIFAIVVIKQLPGGIGNNPLNPAVSARLMLKIFFQPQIANWVQPGPDGISSSTPLEFIGNGVESLPEGMPTFLDVFMGNIGGNSGEVIKWAILIGLAYLLIRKIVDIRVPLATLLGTFLFMLLVSGADFAFASYHVLTGTLLFAAVFMVTDYTSSPLNSRARIVFGFSVGLMTGILRYLFNFPGGIGVAIITMNLFANKFDTSFTQKIFGVNVKEVRHENYKLNV